MDENKLSEILRRLTDKAMEDGKITPDEQSILRTVEPELNNLENYLIQAKTDGIIDEDEENEFMRLKSHVLDQTWQRADNDGTITEEEAELLNLLLKMLKQIKLR